MSVMFVEGIQMVRAGKNVWVRWNSYAHGMISEWVKASKRPEGEGWTPYYPANRITRQHFRYYEGHSEWERAANEAMSQQVSAINYTHGLGW